MEAQDDIRVQLHSKPQLLCALRGLVRSYTANLGFPPDRVDEIVLAVDEACANTIRHSYGGSPEGYIEIRLRSEGGVFELELRDEGAPAPADRVARKPLDQPTEIDQLRPGGLGVHLMHTVFDEVAFESGKDQGNLVRMRLKRPQGDTGTAHGA